MGFTFVCPSCREEIHANEGTEGLHGRCPHCAATFTIPDKAGAFQRQSPRRPDRDGERHDEPRPRYEDEARTAAPLAPGWIIVRNGLLLVRISTIIMLFVALGMVLFTALALGIVPMLERNRQAEMFLGILSIMSGLVFLGGAIMALVGQCMCCAVPDSGPKGLAIGSVVCLVLSLLLGAGAALLIVVQDQQRPFGRPTNLGPVIAALYFLAMALGVVSHTLFGFFLKGIANFFEDQSLSKSAGVYLIAFGTFVASCLVAIMLVILMEASRMPRDREATRIVALVLSVGLLIFALVLALWFLDVLGRVRSTITKALQEGW
ncbi:MAG TPA: hypothetical protein VKE98_05050 [Gemmataceae bacterium]|nr:hypothetical protein [Gemmataceae bacterium]